ncbi:MAG: hypothetical protein QM644_06310 [Mobilitalea sp.]
MSSIKDLMEGHNQGMAYALKIVKESGIEALEKEIKYGNISGGFLKSFTEGNS